MPDHVHIFIDFDPRLTLHKIIKDFKGISARILREEFPYLKLNYHLDGQGVILLVLLDILARETIKEYIDNQKNV